MLTLHPRAVAGVPAEAAAPEDDEGRACYCVVAVAASVWLLLFVVLVAATASVAKACAVSGAAALLLGLAGCLVPSWGCLPAAARRQQQATAATLRLVVHHHHHRCAACGLPDAAIAALPTFAYEPAPPAAKGGGGDKPRRSSSVLLCAVCLEDVRAGEVVRQLPACRHLFHVDCVDAWLRAHRTCPLCRCDLSPPNATAKAAAPAPANTAVTVESSPEALPPV